jgi:peptidoglycan/LPS O-acetylase OafA/YrhL
MSHQLIFGIGFGLIVIFLVCMEKNGVIIGANKIFQLLGAASYSIYLVHIPLFWMIVSFLIKTHTGAYIISSFLIPVFIIIVLIGVASGIGLHFFVEKPLILFFRKRLHV